MSALKRLWRLLTGAQAREDAARQAAAEHQAFLEALKATVAIAQAGSQATQSLAEAMGAWIKMFDTPVAPTRWVHTELSEAFDEAKRLKELKAQGFPVELAGFEAAEWVAEQADRLPSLFHQG